MKGLGASRSSPRDVTFGSKTSLGPFSVSPAWRPWTRSSGVVGSFSMPALPAQRLRTALSADSSPESILFGPLRPRSRALAGSAGQPGLAGQRAGQGLPPGAGAALSTADSAGRPSRIVVHGRTGGAGTFSGVTRPFGSRGGVRSSGSGGPRGARGPAPALKSDDFSLRWCERPGCYEWFAVAWALSPQRFCSSGCRRALRNVLDREARYRQRRRAAIGHSSVARGRLRCGRRDVFTGCDRSSRWG